MDLSGYLDNTDAQTLSLVSNSLSISNGNSVSLAGYLDNTDDQVIDTFSLSTNVLTLSVESDGQPAKTVTFTNWDTNNLDDLTTSTMFSSEVTGTYNSLVIASNVIDSTNIIIDGSVGKGDINTGAVGSLEVLLITL